MQIALPARIFLFNCLRPAICLIEGVSDKDRAFDRVLSVLHQFTGVNFTLYKPATLKRRIQRRMSAQRILSLKAYAQYLRTHPAEVKALFNDVLIQVTSFFRDKAVYQVLAGKFLSGLFPARAQKPIRVWVPGCSTGEEVYSLAIVLYELAARKKSNRAIQIFGTDINESALEKARLGFFSDDITKDVSPQRLRLHFDKVHGGYRIREHIRNLCTFARQNLVADPPFSHLDLISCRNVMIYLAAGSQEKLMPAFHFALRPGGLLLLGSAESVGRHSNLFSVADKKARIYAKKPGSNRFVPELAIASPSFQHAYAGPRPPATPSATLKKKKPLSPARLEAMLHTAVKKNIGIGDDGTRLIPVAIPGTPEKIYLAIVDSESPTVRTTGKDSKKSAAAGDAELARIRRELFTTRKTLQAVIEQEEVANEELRAANEEIVSSNEELQSSNEELETAKEELQSANEELVMLNNELHDRNIALEKAHGISAQFQAIVESSDDAIISKNLNSIILTWNKGAEKIFGYTAEEIVGKSVTTLIPAGQHDEEPRILARLRAGERIDHYETLRQRKDGTLIDISLTVSPIKNKDGRVIGASKIARDITEKKSYERQLARAREDAENASKAKDHFLRALSHELRTPLSPVLLLASDASANTELPPDIRADFDTIRRNVELEARLIDDLLDLTRISSGKLQTDKHNLNLQSLLETSISLIRKEAELKQIVIEEKFNDPHCLISADAVRVQQIFWNILKNAVKFTPAKGRVTVETRAARGECVVKISDTGFGMTPLELEHVFDAFKPGNHSEEARKFGGLGLGMTISKNLAELHSGTIEAFSEGRNRGSTFVVRFPLVHAKSKSTSAPSVAIFPQPSNVRTLLVEDDDSTRDVLKDTLERRNHDVTTAASVRDALDLAGRQQFDLVISDIGLPDGNGYDLFQKLRKQQPSAQGIALTGYGSEDDQARSKDSGFAVHLTKPISIQSLDVALSRISKP